MSATFSTHRVILVSYKKEICPHLCLVGSMGSVPDLAIPFSGQPSCSNKCTFTILADSEWITHVGCRLYTEERQQCTYMHMNINSKLFIFMSISINTPAPSPLLDNLLMPLYQVSLLCAWAHMHFLLCNYTSLRIIIKNYLYLGWLFKWKCNACQSNNQYTHYYGFDLYSFVDTALLTEIVHYPSNLAVITYYSKRQALL